MFFENITKIKYYAMKLNKPGEAVQLEFIKVQCKRCNKARGVIQFSTNNSNRKNACNCAMN